eukprot:161821_1
MSDASHIRQQLQSVTFGTVFSDTIDNRFTISLLDLKTVSMRKNRWRNQRMQTDINSNPLQWNETKKTWKHLAIKSTNHNPNIKLKNIRVDVRYSVNFCKQVEGENNYIQSKRNHSKISLCLMNVKSDADIGRINTMINVVYKTIKQDVLTSLQNGKLMHRKDSEIKEKFNIYKSSYPHRYRV